ncbi:hypothetical protein GXM_05626 [Nostoc sphaeroides CCNUC1]|uniref:Uncharacterized protein n=1 Tax=Nostoc sphaeroides CCNUC1 TaxID=2653204 RepID=A0A5P8W673_9NOSO|nr:hypothetical protein GXM_05626 [Nostoc sphaeroides CCNUC1]
MRRLKPIKGSGDEGDEGAGEAGEAGEEITNAQCPMPHAQYQYQ